MNLEKTMNVTFLEHFGCGEMNVSRVKKAKFKRSIKIMKIEKQSKVLFSYLFSSLASNSTARW